MIRQAIEASAKDEEVRKQAEVVQKSAEDQVDVVKDEPKP